METTVNTSLDAEQTPLRLAYFTSFREIFGPRGQEFVGHNIEGLGYRMGNLEALARRVQDTRSDIGQLLEVALVIHDDTESQMRRMGIDSQTPYEEGNWPWPHDLPVANGQTVHEVTRRVPMYTSEWRRARKAGRTAEERIIREENEIQLAELLMRERIDLLLTDSVTYIFQEDMAMLERFRGCIVNYHPAVLDGETALPGLYPTESALMRYREGRIRGEGGLIIKVPHLQGYDRHGATLHETVAAIDQGSVIHSAENVRIRPEDTQQTLRHRVFEAGHEVLIEGLRRFIRERVGTSSSIQQLNAENLATIPLS